MASTLPLLNQPQSESASPKAKTYRINEVFYSLQGEGIRAGTPNIFVRFSGCNMECSIEESPKSPGGFDCDTEFASGRSVTLDELAEWILTAIGIAADNPIWLTRHDPQHETINKKLMPDWLILTGGEPGLQVDREFCDYFHSKGYKLAIETNGSIELPMVDTAKGVCGPLWNHAGQRTMIGESKMSLLDWVTVSPKVAEHAVRQLWANEVKYVRGWGQAIPKPTCKAVHQLISPAFDGLRLDPKTVQWCTKLCLENPDWRLSLQTHKFLGVR